MKNVNFGGSDELVLLTVAVLMEQGYIVAICKGLSNHTRRSGNLAICGAPPMQREATYEKSPG